MAISLQVMSAPYPLHTRRYGKLPTVVSGARYSLPRLVSDNLGSSRAISGNLERREYGLRRQSTARRSRVATLPLG